MSSEEEPAPPADDFEWFFASEPRPPPVALNRPPSSRYIEQLKRNAEKRKLARVLRKEGMRSKRGEMEDGVQRYITANYVAAMKAAASLAPNDFVPVLPAPANPQKTEIANVSDEQSALVVSQIVDRAAKLVAARARYEQRKTFND